MPVNSAIYDVKIKSVACRMILHRYMFVPFLEYLTLLL